ncbi:hypothetical protein INR49_014438 [Caranx melampygus]|nr:hypothetical protein INR49_014438 [Caranx melampygus]
MSTYLEEKLDSFDGGYSCFGDGSGNTTSQEVLGEGNSLFTHLRVLSAAVPVNSVGGVCRAKFAQVKDKNRESTLVMLNFARARTAQGSGRPPVRACSSEAGPQREDAFVSDNLYETVNHPTEMDINATKIFKRVREGLRHSCCQTATNEVLEGSEAKRRLLPELVQSVSNADVRGLSAVLSDKSGLHHLQWVCSQSSSDAGQSTSKYGPPLRDEAQLVHVKKPNRNQGAVSPEYSLTGVPPSPAGLTTSDACDGPTFCLRLDHLAPSQRLSGITEPSRGNDGLITRSSPHSPSSCLTGVCELCNRGGFESSGQHPSSVLRLDLPYHSLAIRCEEAGLKGEGRILSDKNHQGLLICEGLILGYRVSCWVDEQNDTAVLQLDVSWLASTSARYWDGRPVSACGLSSTWITGLRLFTSSNKVTKYE